MDLTSKKVQKNIIKLALSVKFATFDDLVLLISMINLKVLSSPNVDEYRDSVEKCQDNILHNTHL